MSVRDEVHELVDALPEGELAAARRFLEALQTSPHDSLARFLAAAPEDDEPSTPEQDRSAAPARDAFQRGERSSAAEATQTLLARPPLASPPSVSDLRRAPTGRGFGLRGRGSG